MQENWQEFQMCVISLEKEQWGGKKAPQFFSSQWWQYNLHCLLCITKRPGWTLYSLLHLTRALLSIQASCVFFHTERRKTMITSIGDILFVNVSPHPPSVCQTLIPVTQRHGRTPLQLFSLLIESVPHEHTLFFSPGLPHEQCFSVIGALPAT